MLITSQSELCELDYQLVREAGDVRGVEEGALVLLEVVHRAMLLCCRWAVPVDDLCLAYVAPHNGVDVEDLTAGEHLSHLGREPPLQAREVHIIHRALALARGYHEVNAPTLSCCCW